MRVHLVDGTYELFRAWFGAPESKAPDGREVGAVRGLARQLLSLIHREEATHIAVAFDHTVESFRNELFDGYKTGDGLEPDLLGQFELAEVMTRALGVLKARRLFRTLPRPPSTCPFGDSRCRDPNGLPRISG